MGLRCDEELRYVPCPVCGLPVVEGQCKAGHPWEVRTLLIDEVCDFFNSLNLKSAYIEIIDGAESYVDRSEKWVRFLVTNIFEAENPRPEKQVYFSVYMDARYTSQSWAREAVDEILVEYLYRKDCRNPVQVVEKCNPGKVERKTFTLRETPTRIRFLKEAARFFGIAAGKLIEAYIRKYHIDEVEEKI